MGDGQGWPSVAGAKDGTGATDGQGWPGVAGAKDGTGATDGQGWPSVVGAGDGTGAISSIFGTSIIAGQATVELFEGCLIG